MKIKKETFEKIVLGILTFVLVCYISFGLVFLSMFNVSRKFLNKENVADFIGNINVVDVLREGFFEEFSKIENELKKVGITQEGIENFVNSEEVKFFSENLLNEMFESLLNKDSNNYQINKDIITNLLKDNIDKLQTNSNLTEQQLLDKLNSKIPTLVRYINNLINELFNELEQSDILTKYENYVNISIQLLDIIYSDFVYYIIIFTLISFITLLIFIRKSIYKSLKWLGLSIGISSILLLVFNYFIKRYIVVNSILINNILNIVYRKINMYSAIYMFIAIIPILINIIMFIVKKYKKNKKNI